MAYIVQNIYNSVGSPSQHCYTEIFGGTIGFATRCFGDDTLTCAVEPHAQCGRLSKGFHISQRLHEGIGNRICKLYRQVPFKICEGKTVYFSAKFFFFPQQMCVWFSCFETERKMLLCNVSW